MNRRAFHVLSTTLMTGAAGVTLGSSASAGAFSPVGLFASGEVGGWYDPSDLTTMFQDSAGTTPAALESPVGLIQDKSGNSNHLSQSTSTARPVLSARVNLLTRTEDLTHADWSKSRVTVTQEMITPPTGVSTAWRMADNGSAISNARLFTASNITTVTGRAYKVLFYLKAGTLTEAFVRRFGEVSDGSGVYFNTSTGLTTPVGVGTVSSSMTPLGSGWFRCEAVMTASATTSLFYIGLALGGTSSFQLTSGTQYVIIAGPDMRENGIGVGLPEYQWVGAATYGVTNPSVVIGTADYGTTGFPYYLKFDGTDDFLVSSTISPGAVNKVQVFAGVRKVSDASVGAVAESSANVISNNGSWFLLAPNNTTGRPYGFQSRGTSFSDAFVASGFAAPITNVLTATSDIAGDSAILRINGTQQAQSTSDQGTGNYLAYPMYVGRRAGTTFPFNGHLYSLIFRYSASNMSAAAIADTETWVNQKTGAY